MRLHLVVISLVLLAACGGSRVENVGSMVDRDIGVGLKSTKINAVPGWQTVSQGEFSGTEHTGMGTAKLLKRDDLYLLEFSNFATDKATDLRIILSRDGTMNNAVDVGRLQSFSGYQTYGIPGFVEMDKYHYVLVQDRSTSVIYTQARLK